MGRAVRFLLASRKWRTDQQFSCPGGWDPATISHSVVLPLIGIMRLFASSEFGNLSKVLLTSGCLTAQLSQPS
jgi:hypothetical protein